LRDYPGDHFRRDGEAYADAASVRADDRRAGKLFSIALKVR
jgi:hypothetical protein